MKQIQRIEVRGTVQGVGFRPHVHRQASALGIDGDVRNVDGHVVITAAGEPEALAEFRRRVGELPPAVSHVESAAVSPLPAEAAPPPGFVGAGEHGRRQLASTVRRPPPSCARWRSGCAARWTTRSPRWSGWRASSCPTSTCRTT